ncbi:hypothetical protein Dsin_027237 [Dipteronia sinensis]|uniref:No apical meristem-associated C-terminal domain-containing protein n=1 Tax=Dipteronia sinensis TaxID=43782 RepID=A0AAE0DTD6_9ROSI|nr:hypothetical protein Dsin_027237 [Dipteronia sinensis]
MHRWSAIQLSVNKVCGYYAQIDARQQSGVNEQDKIFQAKALYHQVQGQPFQLLHCWHELKHHPKWMMDGSKKKSKTRKNSSPATSSPCTPTSINLGEDDVSNETFVDFERPIDRKAAKDQHKKRIRKKFNHTCNITFTRISRREKRNEQQENETL